jgi:hypothetical protein
MKGAIVTREATDGSKRYHAVFRAEGKQKWKTFARRKDAERFLAGAVKSVHDGAWRDLKPVPFGEVLDAWLTDLDVRVNERSIKGSTANLYRTMVRSQIRPAFGNVRTDRLTHVVVNEWRSRCAKLILEGDLSAGHFNNVVTLLGTIVKWDGTRTGAICSVTPWWTSAAPSALVKRRGVWSPKTSRRFSGWRRRQTTRSFGRWRIPGSARARCLPFNGATSNGATAPTVGVSTSAVASTRAFSARPRRRQGFASSTCPSRSWTSWQPTARPWRPGSRPVGTSCSSRPWGARSDIGAGQIDSSGSRRRRGYRA